MRSSRVFLSSFILGLLRSQLGVRRVNLCDQIDYLKRAGVNASGAVDHC